MSTLPKFIQPAFRSLPIVLGWSVVIGLMLGAFFCPSCFGKNWYFYFKISAHSAVMTFCIWMGNVVLTDYLNEKMEWMDAPLKRTFWGVSLTLLVTIGLFIAVNVILIYFFYENVSVADELRNTTWRSFLIPIVITLIFTLAAHGVGFFKEWRTAFVENENLKRAHLASQYETLKNQVNPHFLFNSLNALSTLVYKDQDLAAKFIKQLSIVYRHVLDTKDKEVVPLSVELEALEAYIFLIHIRFGESLKVNLDIPKTANYLIIPLALQMLVENAVKHNIISRRQPLTIDIYLKDEIITVSNNLQVKKNVGESSGIGLTNIQARYQYISNKTIDIQKTDTDFTVKVPLLEYD